MRYALFIAIAALISASFFAPQARADHRVEHIGQAQLTPIQDLSFGVFGLKNNDSVHTIIVAPDNTYTSGSAFITGIVPQRGEYFLDNLTPNTALTLSVSDGSLTLGGLGAGEAFTTTTYTHNSPITDANGDATLYLGATFSTSGSSAYYPSGNYSDNVDIIINF